MRSFPDRSRLPDPAVVLPRLKAELGIALPVALFALVLIGALVSASFFAGLLEHQSGQNTIFAAQALEAAQAGLSEAVVNADLPTIQALGIGEVLVEDTLVLGERARAGWQISRLTGSLFLVRATGSRRSAGGTLLATRSLGMIVRLTAPDAGLGTPARLSPIPERAWVQLY